MNFRRFIIKSSIAVLGLSISTGSLLGTSDSEREQVPIDQLFIPAGIVQGDDVDIVVRGNMPNSCRTDPSVNWRLNDHETHIQLELSAAVSSEAACTQAVVSFEKVIHLGRLKAGTYTISANQGAYTASLEVSAGGRALLTAAVDDAWVEPSLEGASILHIRGPRESTCFGEPQIEVHHNKTSLTMVPKVIVYDSPDCISTDAEYAINIKIADAEAAERMIFVLRINGTPLKVFQGAATGRF